MKKEQILYSILLIFMMLIKVDAYEIDDTIIDWGGSGSDFFWSVTATSDGGYVVIGGTTSTDIDNITNNGSSDAVIVKYDSTGNIEWQQNYGGNGYDYFYDAIETSDGGYVMIGGTTSTDIDGITNSGSCDGIIVKYDSSGSVEWQQSYGGSKYDEFVGVTTTIDGGYIAVGYINSTDIDGITNNGSSDAIIIKYDSDGNLEWQQGYGCSSYGEFVDVIVTSDNGYVVVGEKDTDAIIVKYDSDGNIEWQQSHNESSYEYFMSVTKAQDDGYVVVGATGSNDTDAIIIKYDSNGNLEWQQSYDENSYEYFMSVTKAQDGGYVVVGATGSNDIDAIIVKYDSNGNLEWQKEYGENNYELFIGATTIFNGDIIVVGVDMDITTNDNDALIVRLSFIYDMDVEDSNDGEATVIQENNLGKLTITPNEGYEVDTITITDSSGNTISYYYSNGYYYFDLYDDVVISVTYKEKSGEEIINPNTGINLPYIILSIFIIVVLSVLILTKKKKYI